MNAGVTPVFADISRETFMLDCSDVRGRIGPQTRALIATHMWGNPENIAALQTLARERGLLLIEDACLELGSVADGKPAGSRAMSACSRSAVSSRSRPAKVE